MGEENEEKPEMKTIPSVRVPISLIPVYVVLALQFLGVVFVAGAVINQLKYHGKNIEEIQVKLDYLRTEGTDDRFRRSEFLMWEKEFERDVMFQIRENKTNISDLKNRVIHFQAQFPSDKRINGK